MNGRHEPPDQIQARWRPVTGRKTTPMPAKSNRPPAVGTRTDGPPVSGRSALGRLPTSDPPLPGSWPGDADGAFPAVGSGSGSGSGSGAFTSSDAITASAEDRSTVRVASPSTSQPSGGVSVTV